MKELAEILKENKEMMELFKDEKTIETFAAIKEFFVEKVLERGDIRLLILDAISDEPKHGYQIITYISKRFACLYKPSPGAIYPTLQSLEEEGLVKCEETGKKKVYSLSQPGRKYLKENQERVKEIFSCFCDSYYGSDARVSKKLESMAALWVKIAHEAFYKSRESLKKNDSDAYKKMGKVNDILEKTLEEVKSVW